MNWQNQPTGDGLYVWHTKPPAKFECRGFARVINGRVTFLGDDLALDMIKTESHAIDECAPRLWCKLPEVPK